MAQLFSWMTAALALTVSATSALAQDSDRLALFVSPSWARTKSDSVIDGSPSLGVGIWMPNPGQSHSFGVSLERLIEGGTETERTDILVHAGYRIGRRIRPAFLAGVEYIHDSGSSFLKPLIGAKLDGWVYHSSTHEVSLSLAYKVAQGGTGSIALDSGSDDLSARIVTVGLTWWLNVLD